MRIALVAAAALICASPVLAMGSAQPETTDDYAKAVKAVEGKNFGTAEKLLTAYIAKNTGNADALNYLGYSQRNLGKTDDAMASYNKALAIDPNHKGALEYQGELYLKLGNMDAAKANLAKLDVVCATGCAERDELQAAIERVKDGKTAWSAPR